MVAFVGLWTERERERLNKPHNRMLKTIHNNKQRAPCVRREGSSLDKQINKSFSCFVELQRGSIWWRVRRNWIGNSLTIRFIDCFSELAWGAMRLRCVHSRVVKRRNVIIVLSMNSLARPCFRIQSLALFLSHFHKQQSRIKTTTKESRQKIDSNRRQRARRIKSKSSLSALLHFTKFILRRRKMRVFLSHLKCGCNNRDASRVAIKCAKIFFNHHLSGSFREERLETSFLPLSCWWWWIIAGLSSSVALVDYSLCHSHFNSACWINEIFIIAYRLLGISS